MVTTVNLPDALHERLKQLAEAEAFVMAVAAGVLTEVANIARELRSLHV